MLKPLLGPCDSYQLEPFAYEWAWTMARAQENNNWAPEEIAVAPDVADYKDPTLDPKHKHLFVSVMAQLTTFDIERGDDAAGRCPSARRTTRAMLPGATPWPRRRAASRWTIGR